jgi:lysophospholipase L1-like esterase
VAPSRARQRVFVLLAVSIPVLTFGAVEGSLRAMHYKGDLSLFVPVQFLKRTHAQGKYAATNERFAARYFVNVRTPPTPPSDLFFLSKPTNGFRVFVLGESSAAGFPYGYNGTFSRVLQDALQDVLPSSTVEVVNLGVAAVTSYTLYDEVDEILAQQPDAVLIYAGHNEFYGALGAGSTETLGAVPAVVRTYLRLQRLKTVLLTRDLAAGLARRLGPRTGSARDSSRSLMQQLVREELIPLDSPTYRRGREQFRDNLRAILKRFRDAGVPAFVGSLTSNLRDQPPFRSVATPKLPAADRVFGEAWEALGRGDPAAARSLFEDARDLDALRFRAPGEFNAIIRTVTRETGAHYVPVDEAFRAVSNDGIPGSKLFWEHVHPNQTGYHLMGKVFFEAIKQVRFLGRAADTTRLRNWRTYYDRMELTEFDRRFAWHEIRSLTTSWPFVERQDPSGHPRDYRPLDAADSLAFEAVNRRSTTWPWAKFALAGYYRSRGQLQLALAEYRGLMREQPENAVMRVYAADVLLRLHHLDRARDLLERAYAMEPSGPTCYALGALELKTKRYVRAIQLLEQSQQFHPDNPPALLALSRAYVAVRDVRRARAYADRLSLVSPGFPGLAEWRARLATLPD